MLSYSDRWEVTMTYTHLLFDLDGTITNPKLGITNAVIYALAKYGITDQSNDDLLKFIGPPLKDSFINYFGFTKEEAVTAIEYFREYYRDKGLYENILYDGIGALLKTLKDNGYILAIATSKPTPFAKTILQYFELDGYFEFIGGSKLDNTRTAKSEVIEHVLENLNIQDISKVIMIGDREHDIHGAKSHNMKSIGVLYGFGSREEFEQSGADIIVESVADLEQVLLQYC